MILKFPLTGEPPAPPYGYVFRPYRLVSVEKDGWRTLVSYHPWLPSPNGPWTNQGSFPFFDNAEEAAEFLRENQYLGVVRRWDLEKEAWGGPHPLLGWRWFPWRNQIDVLEVT